ncbi:MAG: hypothetical protein GY896_22160 [Gammaproteobacteria bacterium]|nr:hypothetical protein [Gammaproteobacteria bacterium]
MTSSTYSFCLGKGLYRYHHSTFEWGIIVSSEIALWNPAFPLAHNTALQTRVQALQLANRCFFKNPDAALAPAMPTPTITTCAWAGSVWVNTIASIAR